MHSRALLLVVLLAVTLGVFMRTGNYEFINFDDPMYVPDNRYVKQGITGENILWAFTATTPSNWHPLTWLSHMLDIA